MGHVGLTPQSIHRMGGHRVQGRNERGRERVLAMPGRWRPRVPSRW